MKKEIELCIEWINNNCTIRKTINWKGLSSYEFKHRVEEHYNTYIHNDDFIKAASELNLKSGCIDRNNVNYVFNLSY